MGRSRWLVIGAVVGLGIIVVIYRMLLPDDESIQGPQQRGQAQTSTLKDAWEELRKKKDVATCRSVLQQVTNHLTRNPQDWTISITEEQKQFWKETCGLESELIEEVSNPRFTALDARHLEKVLLLSDAVQSTGLPIPNPYEKAVDETKLSRSRKAEIVFHQVIRQIALFPSEDGAFLQPIRKVQLPPRVALSFGVHTCRSRALVFLQMLQQLRIPAGLVGFGQANEARYWACGVVGEQGEIYLFDPRLGLPLPGPDGKGIATLQEMQSKPEEILNQLDFGKSGKYDVTAEQVKKSRLSLVVSLSAMAPRMKYLERHLFKNYIPVCTYINPQQLLHEVKQALKQAGSESIQVDFARWGCDIQRRFYPEEDGGVGSKANQTLAIRAIVPFQILQRSLPQNIWRDEVTGREILTGPNGELLQLYFDRFIKLSMEPGFPRDLILRGQYSAARQQLEQRRDQLEQTMQAFNKAGAKSLVNSVLAWHKKSIDILVFSQNATSASDKSQVKLLYQKLWKDYGQRVTLFVQGLSAEPLQIRCLYLIAIALQEQANRIGLQIEHAGPSDELLAEAIQLREAVSNLWRRFENDHPNNTQTPTARQHSAITQEALKKLYQQQHQLAKTDNERQRLQSNINRVHQYAISLWEQTAEELKGLPALGCLYHAKRLRAAK